MSIEKSKWERCLKASPVVSVRNWCQASIPNAHEDRKSTRLNSSHDQISYAVFCLKKKINFQYSSKLPASSAQNSRDMTCFDNLSLNRINPLGRSSREVSTRFPDPFL